MQEKYKVLYLDSSQDLPGGGQVSLLLLLNFLDKTIYQPNVFSLKTSKLHDTLKNGAITAKVVPAGRLFAEIRELNPDLIHCNSPTTKYTFLAAIYSWVMKIPFIWHVRVIDKSFFRDTLLYSLSNKVIAISNAVKEKFIFKRKIHVISNGVDLNRFKLGIDSQKIKDEFRIKPGERVIGMVARVDKWKGFEYFIKMASIVLKQNSNVRFLIIGPEPDNLSNELKHMSESLGISEKIHFLGFRDDIPQLISAMDVLVHAPVSNEAFGRAIIEAMALKKPVVASSVGGIPEIIESGQNGILVKAADPDGMAKECIKLLNDRTLSELLGNNARTKVENTFTAEKTALKIMNLYLEILAKHAKKSFKEKVWNL